MTNDVFGWDNELHELEILDTKRLTFVPFGGNRCWALLPTSLDWYCYIVDMPNWMRVLRRLGVYLQIDRAKGPIATVLDQLHVCYGANYLRLKGHAGDVSVEIRVFPDVQESVLFLALSLQNDNSADKDIKVTIAADFEFHKTTWGCKGFTEDSTGDYSGMHRRPGTPRDDKIRKRGAVFFAYDSRNTGTGFIAAESPSRWTLDRSRFSFETPCTGYHPGRLDEGDIDWTNENESDDGFCAFQVDVRVVHSQKSTLPIAIGYQDQQDEDKVLSILGGHELAFDRTRNLYQKPMLEGIKVETPDPIMNAQFQLYDVFMKMNEHHCGEKTGFLPAAHYYNWLCGDSLCALPSYSFTRDWGPIIDGLDLFRKAQLPDGFIPNLPLWSEGTSWRERGALSVLEGLNYIMTACSVMKVIRDRRLGAEYLPSLRLALDCVLKNEKEELIFPGGEYAFDAIDWPCGYGHCPQTFSSVCTVKSMHDLSDLAEWLGETGYAHELRSKAAKLKDTINDKLWMEDRGYYRVGLPIGKTGKDERDEQLFSREMISWGSLVAVVWGVAEGKRATRTIENVKKRLCSVWGVKLFDPEWSPYYTDVKNQTYEAGRVQNGAYWLCWYTLEYLVRAENILGKSKDANRHLLDIRLDNVYNRCTMEEKGRLMYFIRSGEWIDSDHTFPITSIPYLLTAAFFNQTLLESIIGIQVGFEQIHIEPHLPSTWPSVRIRDLTIGDSRWSIQIQGHGKIKRLLVDGEQRDTVAIKPGDHSVQVVCS